MSYFCNGNLIEATCPFLSVTADERDCSTFLEKLGTVLHLPYFHPHSLSNTLDINFFHMNLVVRNLLQLITVSRENL